MDARAVDYVSAINEFANIRNWVVKYEYLAIGEQMHNRKWICKLIIHVNYKNYNEHHKNHDEYSAVEETPKIHEFKGEGRSTKIAKQYASKEAYFNMHLDKLADSDLIGSRNYIGELNSIAQLNSAGVPNYHRTSENSDSEHRAVIELTIKGKKYTAEASGKKFKDAKQNAAKIILKQIADNPPPSSYPTAKYPIGPEKMVEAVDHLRSDSTLSGGEHTERVHRIEHTEINTSINKNIKNGVLSAHSIEYTPSVFGGSQNNLASAATTQDTPGYNRAPYIETESYNNLANEECACGDYITNNTILFIDADNAPREACKHFKCRAFLYIGKLTNFPPRGSNVCSSSRVRRCNWHSSDAADVYLAMELAKIAVESQQNMHSENCIEYIIISGDKIMQSVQTAALQLGIKCRWERNVPINLTYQ